MSEENVTELATATSDTADITTKMSKRQLKRQKKKERWQEIKHLKRAKEKEKKKQRKREALERGEDLGPSRKQLKHNKMTNSSCRQRVVLDCSFDHLMGDREVSKLVKQLGHSYAVNRRAENPIQCYITSLGDKTKAKLESFGDYRSWDVHFEEREYLSVFNKDDVVYLTSESPNVISTLDENKVYIIGGLVDYNHHKGMCYDLAVKNGIAHGRLPIGDYVKMKTRQVLTVDQVFEILLRFTETKNWEVSFLKVIPLRKGVVALGEKDRDDSTAGEDSVNSTDDKGDEKKSSSDTAGNEKLCISSATVETSSLDQQSAENAEDGDHLTCSIADKSCSEVDRTCATLLENHSNIDTSTGS